MPAAPRPADDEHRVAVLRGYGVLDAPADPLLDDLVRLAARLIGVPIALVNLVDQDRQLSMARYGMSATVADRDDAFCGHAILDPSRIMVIEDASLDPRLADNIFVTGPDHIRFYAGAPLLGPELQPLGTLCVLDRKPRKLSPEQAETLAVLGRAVSTTLELHRSAARMRDLALTDPLTGLGNRRALEAALARAIATCAREARPFALLLLDLDGFKAINDRAGHAAGDRLLQAVAGALQATVRGADAVARLGGDEFAVLLESGEDTAAAGERIRLAIAARATAAGADVTASVGGVGFTTPPSDPATALAAVDQQLYAAKRAGRNCVRCRDPVASLAAA